MDNKINFQTDSRIMAWHCCIGNSHECDRDSGHKLSATGHFLHWNSTESAGYAIHHHTSIYIFILYIFFQIYLYVYVFQFERVAVVASHVPYMLSPADGRGAMRRQWEKLSFIELNLLISIVHHIADKVIQRQYANGVNICTYISTEWMYVLK